MGTLDTRVSSKWRTVALTSFVTTIIVSSVLLSSWMTVRVEYDDLKTEHNLLEGRYENLSSAYHNLETDYETLQSQYDDLDTQYNTLDIRYNTLKSKHDSLQSQNEYLLSRYNYYQGIESWYNLIKDEVNLRQGVGWDRQEFVTPDDSEVGRLVAEITGGWRDQSDWSEYWDDMKKMYDWVKKNVYDSYDSPTPYLPSINGSVEWYEEFWRFPNETIECRAGDCEDQSVLLLSMILNYGQNEYAAWVVIVTCDEFSHAGVFCPVEDGRLRVLDPAMEFCTKEDGQFGSKNIRAALDDWFRYLEANDLLNPSITMIFSDWRYRTFESTEEFIEWVQDVYG